METVKPYSLEGSKKEQVASMFNAISRRYDVLNRTLSLGIDVLWRKKTVRSIQTHHPLQVLDVATGTGDLAIALARALPNATVKGIDISSGMLEVCRQKLVNQSLGQRVELLLGDGEQLPFAEASFDAVTVAFGVRNFEHLTAGLQEMHRVLRPEKPLAVLEFSQPEKQPFRALYFFYFQYILPTIGKWVSRDASAYTYLPASVKAFPYGQEFANELLSAGFTRVHIQPLTFGIATLYVAEK